MTIIDQVSERFKEDADYICKRTKLGEMPATVMALGSLVDMPRTMLNIGLQIRQSANPEQLADALAGGIGETLIKPEAGQLAAHLTAGRMIAAFEASDICISIAPAPKTLTRSIEAPLTENVLRGSVSAFNEDIDSNLGMLRKQVVSDRLRALSYQVGSDQRKRITVLYLEHRVNRRLLDAIVRRIESRPELDVTNLQSLNGLLGLSKWSIVTRLNSTELPQQAASAMEKGKAVILVDRYPFAFIVPSLLWDMFDVENDRNYPISLMYSFRLLRIIGVLVNVIFPGLYVALVSVNPDVLRIEMALSVAASRIDVPYPAFVETLILLIILELILEASVRLPKSIGPTITMVGGIILGQAVVSAKLVSNLLIIILAATTIASFTVAGFQNAISIRVFKYIILILSAVFGVFGLLSGLVVVCGYLASVTSFGIPYLHMARARDDAHG